MWPSNSKTNRGLACLVGLTLTLPLLGGGVSRAESRHKIVDPCLSDPACSGLYEEARRLSKSGDLQAALVAYQAAYRRQPVPWLLINLGRTLQKLGRLQEALANYQRYSTAEPAGPAARQQMVREYTAQAEKTIAEKAANPTEPSPTDKPPVDHSVDRTAAPVIEPPPAQDEPPPAKPEPPAVHIAPPPIAPPTVANPPIITPPAVVTKEPGLPRYFWAGIGVGGGLLTAGIITGSIALNQSHSLQETPYAGAAPDTLVSKQAQVRALAATTDALLAVGGATLGVVTVVTLVQYFRHRGEPASVATQPVALGPGGLFGRF